ncbi:ATP-dependent DNA helicase RecG, partial [gut metagenome]
TDGFVIAEEDLKLRGPGDLEGTAQSGMPFDLKIANLTKDQELMEIAREAAADVLEHDPTETLPQNEVVWSHLRLLKKTMINFSAIS